MMVISPLRSDKSFLDFLELQARGESVKELAARAGGAFGLALAGFGALPWGSAIVATLSLAYFCYAVWGLLDRARSYSVKSGRQATARYLGVLCGFVFGLGVASGIGSIFAIGFALLGAPWIL
jgi:hypothetical protein